MAGIAGKKTTMVTTSRKSGGTPYRDTATTPNVAAQAPMAPAPAPVPARAPQPSGLTASAIPGSYTGGGGGYTASTSISGGGGFAPPAVPNFGAAAPEVRLDASTYQPLEALQSRYTNYLNNIEGGKNKKKKGNKAG